MKIEIFFAKANAFVEKIKNHPADRFKTVGGGQ